MASSSAPAVADSSMPNTTGPQVILVLGMAGSGKSTYVSRLLYELQTRNKRTFAINLDPAVRKLPYSPNVDIRDSVDYTAVMKDFDLGPNGAIMTALNLFVTKFDQVLDVLESKRSSLDYIVVDTPGQIEVFNWSASGQIISDAFSLSFPTVITYVLDSERCSNPLAFVSNMTYVVSVLFKYRLPFILVLNKSDISDSSRLALWFADFSVLLDALAARDTQENADENFARPGTYMGAFSRSLCLALEEFYTKVVHVPVSSLTGNGFEELVVARLPVARQKYVEEFLPEIEQRRAALGERKLQEAKKTVAAMKTRRSPKKDEEDEEDEDAAELEKLRAMLKAKK